MNKPESQIPEEMLSAYLDGEVTPQEEREISIALEQSADMRALLSDLKQIRLEIQNLPKRGLSQEFASRVVQVCTKQDSHESDQVIVASTSKRTQRDSSRLRAIIGITATAATILVALWAVRPGNSLFTTAKVGDSGRDEKRSVPMAAEAIHTEAADAPSLQSASPTGVTSESDEAQGPKGLADGGLGGRGRVGRISAAGGYSADSSMDSLSDAKQEAQQNRPFDAVVQITLSRDQLASNDNWRSFRFDNSEGMREQRERGVSGVRRNELTEAGEDDLQGVAIPEGAQLRVLVGTREEIAVAFGDISALPTSITMLDPNANAESIGLPSVKRLEESGQKLGVDSRYAQTVESVPLATAAEERSAVLRLHKEPGKAQSAPTGRSTNRAPNDPTNTFADANRAEELEELPQYRILLIVQPLSKAVE